MLKTLAVTLLLIAPAVTLQALPAFPGAEGCGSTTPGGRGGRVIEVTTLADDGPGSFREACTTPGPRIIVFKTGGTIELVHHLRVIEPSCTIAAQTAPGGGILLRNAGLYIETHDVIVRGIRVRIGDSLAEEYDTQDPLHIDGEGCYNIIVDHSSFSWSNDECIGISGGAHDVTFSWNIVAEPLEQPYPPEITDNENRKHAFCMMLGGTPERLSVHHNLLANADHRNPRIQGGTHEFSNNVVYNWRSFTGVFSRYPNVNFTRNYYKMGPESKSIPPISDREDQLGMVYVEGNIAPTRPTNDLPEWPGTSIGAESAHRSYTRFDLPELTLTSAEEAYTAVLAGAGARVPQLDSVDARVIGNVQNRTGTIIDKPSEVGGYPNIATGTAPPDGDHDGMPDEWEDSHGLNKTDPADTALDRDGDGYSNIEEYINSFYWVQVEPTPTPTGTPEPSPTPTQPAETSISVH